METVQVEFVRSHPGFVHEVGETTTLRKEDALALLESGHVVTARQVVTETATLNTKAEKAVVK